MVLAYDETIDNEGYAVSKRLLFDADALNAYSGHVAFTVDDGLAMSVMIFGGHTSALAQARALNAVAAEDSDNEPPDFVVDDGFDI